jgi:hypothetical protein
MRQPKGEDEPPPQPAADDPTPMEDEKPVTGEEEAAVVAAADAGAADPVVGPSSPAGAGAGAGVEEDGEGRSVDPPVDAVGEAEKLENGDGLAKADGDAEEGSGSDGENKAVDLQDQPAEDDTALPKVSNNFFFDYTTGDDDFGTEEEQAEFMKELERFYREKMMEFKPPKFYGEGLNCLK